MATSSVKPEGTLRAFLFIAALPLILLWVNDSWSWDSTKVFDNHVYVGFFKHYLEFNYPYTENYKSSRLPFILPGVFLYRFLPDELAHQALLLLFLIGQSFFTFLWTRRHFGPHAAFAVAAAQAVFTNSHHDPSYHNLAACTYLIASLWLLDAPSRWPFWWRGIASGAAFTCAVCTNSISVALTPLFGLCLLYALPRPWRWYSIPLQGLCVVVGAALIVSALGGINFLLGGPFIFFAELFDATRNVVDGKVAQWGQVGFSQFREIWKHPLLLLPSLAFVSAIWVLARGLMLRRWSMGEVISIAFLTSISTAVFIHGRFAQLNHGILEHVHLFSVFMVPTWLMIGASLRCIFAGRTNIEQPTLGLGFLVLVSAACIVPLTLFGMDFSLHQMRLQGRESIYASGFIFAFRLFLVTAGACFLLRFSPRGGAFTGALALGIMNPLCPEKGQPANLYDYRTRCSLRQDTFSAMIEADRVFGEFDPTNHAYWTYPSPYGDEPGYNGRDWCTVLPVAAVARTLRLTRYFFTTKQFVDGFIIQHPLEKVSLTALGDGQAQGLLSEFKASHPGPFEYTKVMAHTITRPTFSLVIQGYEVKRTDGR